MDAVKYIEDAFNLDKFKRVYYFEEGEEKFITINSFEEQNINFSTTITKNPVEFGINLNDTSFRNPIIIKAIILVSDSSSLIGSVVGTIKGISFKSNEFISSLKDQGIKLIDADSSGLLNSSKVYNELIKINQNFLDCKIITRDRIYRNLQITNIGRKIAVDNYGGCAVECTFEELMLFNIQSNNLLADTPKSTGWKSLVAIGVGILSKFI